ncbi:hypothetical protein F8388_025802 [Cannabis sativa]|uniref:Disease resistance N-terminal domain-containing protein n=1 Tax=Cannabis sativa TaxID=3483 RepID=A0A7J6HP43_CANSA|nr:hypothetical protein F8388_025802 [Cannabis sativa]KAF4397037.1 hypothetical protein G4B88_008883 [Cannabis sativa]
MVSMSCECQKLLSSLILFTHIALIALICFLIHSYCCSVPIPYISIAITFCEPLTELNWNMAELVIGAVISSSLDFLLKRVASPYFKEFFKENESSVVSERLFKLKSTLNCLAAVRFEVENKRIKNPAVEKWLEDLLDAVNDAEDFFGKSYFVMHDLIVDLARIVSGKYSCLLEHNEDIVKLEKKTRHFGCVTKLLYLDHKMSNSFEATRLRTFLTLALSVSDGKSLHELTSLSSLQIDSCCSFVSFPKGGLIAPKLSEFTISNCPKLKWLPEKMALLSSLKFLILFRCPLIETFPEGGSSFRKEAKR